MQKDELLLGKHTDYPKEYNPTVLQPISRLLARESLPFGMNLGKGFDAWHLFEMSWLNAVGVPQVAIFRLLIPANSPNIVESKSLKLYCNSLNFKIFNNTDELINTVRKDVGHTVKAVIGVQMFAVNALLCTTIANLHPDAINIDENPLSISAEEISFMMKAHRKRLFTQKNTVPVKEKLYSHLLRSNCPVTDQPDWGSVLIHYEGIQIDRSELLSYICSFREHNGFHEQCVEQIFADIMTVFKPKRLLVQAWYTRRGGIDISPCRVSDSNMLPNASRLVRQ